MVGPILLLDLRMLGILRMPALSAIGPLLSRTAMIGVGLAILTGLCLFSVRPTEYAGNTAFLAKLALIAIGIANALLVHAGPSWRAAVHDRAIAFDLRLQAALSLLIWPATIVAGRWIGFL